MKNKKIVILTTCFIVIMIILFCALAFCILNIANDNKGSRIEDLMVLNEKISNIPSFDKSSMKDISKENVKEIFDIESEYINNVVGKIPLLNITSSMYVIIELNSEDRVSFVKSKIEAFAKEYEKTWESYMEDQYNIVLDREIGSKGKYVYLIISDDKKDILELINKII